MYNEFEIRIAKENKMDKIVFLEPVFCERIWGKNLEKFDFSIPQGNIEKHG